MPRHLRFKQANVNLVGIIPDMAKEPPTNSFLSPLREELNEAWVNGFHLHSSASENIEAFHLALRCYFVLGAIFPQAEKYVVF